jgi:squalene synthase HpnC
VSVDHYENFPVASWLCPRALRPAVTAIYRFARTADDLADEGTASVAQRLADLAAYRADLEAIAAGRCPSTRWARVFHPLRATLARHVLPLEPFRDLLSAFEQDVVKHAYCDRAELLDYCRRSANPVGRLMLHLYAVNGSEALQQSDAICTGLQLANFWQDFGIDVDRGRLYLPTADCARHGVDPVSLCRGLDAANVRSLLADMVDWARGCLQRGAPLARHVPGSAGWELRLVVLGGLRILEKIERGGFATLQSRPGLRWSDAPLLAWRSLHMKGAAAGRSGHPA